MISILAGKNSGRAEEAENAQEQLRLTACLEALGYASQLVKIEDIKSAAAPSLVLSHVKTLDELDVDLSVVNVMAFGGPDEAESAVDSLRKGAVAYLPAGADVDCIRRTIGRTVREHVTRRNTAQEQTPGVLQPGICAASLAMNNVISLAEKVARADISVLISGESGTGKEVVARHIHRCSPRADGPFVAINCAAVPETMLEAVLFGHEKGAFTGASERKTGKFELADGGTLLLDEITEMPIELQAKLLRALQEREIERLGSAKPRKVNVRVLATTNRPTASVVADGVLREDLFYRLSVFPLHIPPLRERLDDIMPLAEGFVAQYAAGQSKTISAAAEKMLKAHIWPGNVRELENCVQRALVLCETDALQPADLVLQPVVTTGDTLQERVRLTEESVLLDKLAANNGARKITAQQLGISERTLRYKLKQLKDKGVL